MRPTALAAALAVATLSGCETARLIANPPPQPKPETDQERVDFALTRACSRYQLAFAAEVSTRGPNSEARRVAAERIDADVDPLCFPEDRLATRADVAFVEAATVRMTILAARGSDAEALDP